MEETIIIEWKRRRCASSAWNGLPDGISAESIPGQREREGRGLTLSELGREYAQAAEALRERIRLVERELDGETEEDLCGLIKVRLRLLRSMYRDTRQTARHLEHYYDKGGSHHEDDIL